MVCVGGLGRNCFQAGKRVASGRHHAPHHSTRTAQRIHVTARKRKTRGRPGGGAGAIACDEHTATSQYMGGWAEGRATSAAAAAEGTVTGLAAL